MFNAPRGKAILALADGPHSSDASDPVEDAAEVTVECALAMSLWKEAHGHLLEQARLQSVHEDPCQEAREGGGCTICRDPDEYSVATQQT